MKQRELFLLTIPVLMGYIPLGAAFGILAASKDFSLFEILLSSIFIYAGAGQFLLVAVGGKIKCRKRKIKCRIFATNYLSFNLKLKL